MTPSAIDIALGVASGLAIYGTSRGILRIVLTKAANVLNTYITNLELRITDLEARK